MVYRQKDVFTLTTTSTLIAVCSKHLSLNKQSSCILALTYVMSFSLVIRAFTSQIFSMLASAIQASQAILAISILWISQPPAHVFAMPISRHCHFGNVLFVFV